MNMAEALNLGCLCSTLQPELFRAELDARPGLQGMAQKLAIDQPHLFSTSPVFISASDFDILAQSVSVLHRIADLPAYQACALQRSSPIASKRWGPQGVFMGYDFHMGMDGPRLIEINTNAEARFFMQRPRARIAPAASRCTACSRPGSARSAR